MIGGLAFVAVRQRNRAEQSEQPNRRLLYSAQMNLAARDWQDSSIAHMRDLLAQQSPQPGQTDLRGFEWYLLWALAHPDRQTLPIPGAFQCIVFSPDLKMFATGEEAGVKLWDLATSRQVRSLKPVDTSSPTYSHVRLSRTIRRLPPAVFPTIKIIPVSAFPIHFRLS